MTLDLWALYVREVELRRWTKADKLLPQCNHPFDPKTNLGPNRVAYDNPGSRQCHSSLSLPQATFQHKLYATYTKMIYLRLMFNRPWHLIHWINNNKNVYREYWANAVLINDLSCDILHYECGAMIHYLMVASCTRWRLCGSCEQLTFKNNYRHTRPRNVREAAGGFSRTLPAFSSDGLIFDIFKISLNCHNEGVSSAMHTLNASLMRGSLHELGTLSFRTSNTDFGWASSRTWN